MKNTFPFFFAVLFPRYSNAFRGALNSIICPVAVFFPIDSQPLSVQQNSSYSYPS